VRLLSLRAAHPFRRPEVERGRGTGRSLVLAVAIGLTVPLFAGTLGAPTAARAAGLLTPCRSSSVVLCGTVSVALDRKGMLPGTISLHVEQLPATGSPRGVLFLLAGGPGQAATRAFDLAAHGEYLRSVVPAYTLVAFDPRGTGQSDVLRCPSFDAGLEFVDAMAKCAGALGPAASLYTTREHVEDVEAVRAALGVRKIALWGVSYGAKLAVAYAFAHPEGVERLLLDSPLPADGPHPYARPTLQSLPRALRALCSGGFCRSATPNLSAELASLANSLEKKPLQKGSVFVDGESLLTLAVDADANGGVRAQLPTAVAEARRGRPGLLIRLRSPRGIVPPDPTFSFPLYVATTCGDGSFPWQSGTPLADRERAYEAAVAALPRGATGPFGRWAARRGTALFCSLWPPSGPGAQPASRIGPDVPVLVLTGGFDMRTPTESARGVARLFRRARVLVVPGVGHSVLASDSSGCAARAVLRWLGGAKPASCRHVRPVLAPVGRLTPLGQRRVPVERALEAVAATLRSAAAAWYTAGRPTANAIPGVRAGLLSGRGDFHFALRRFSDVEGVAVTGRLNVVAIERGPMLQLEGTVTVSGRRDVRGIVTVSGGRLAGRLGGVSIPSWMWRNPSA
jgi:pimeloyl-ACP methyl ester carboxylesterase